MASLFQACKAAVRNKEGGTFNIGGYDIDIEMYSQQDIDDDIQYGDIAFGDDDESKIVLVAGDTITVPAGYTLTPDKPKKSLVIFCNTLVNNGTISMYQKAPNVLPHDYYIIQGSVIESDKNVIIPAYANNNTNTSSGTNGTNRNCGSGGWGDTSNHANGNHVRGTFSIPGTAYAFGGGAGSGGALTRSYTNDKGVQCSTNSTYPMRGGTPFYDDSSYGAASGGAGNPYGGTLCPGRSPGEIESVYGCGGRIIIFCCSFENNGNINVNGTSRRNYSFNATSYAPGGCSGAGAVDLFYTSLTKEGTMTANGGTGPYAYNKGGNGSVTLTQWNLDKVIKEERKMFTKNNWIYLFDNYSQRLREDVI